MKERPWIIFNEERGRFAASSVETEYSHAWNRQKLGRYGEQRVGQLLTQLGHQVLHRNLRLGASEIDLVARKKGGTLLVEVRSTSKNTADLERSLSSQKLHHMARAQRRFQEKFKHKTLRYDLALFMIKEKKELIEYIKGALSTWTEYDTFRYTPPKNHWH